MINTWSQSYDIGFCAEKPGIGIETYDFGLII
jgi:hypothetical protein